MLNSVRVGGMVVDAGQANGAANQRPCRELERDQGSVMLLEGRSGRGKEGQGTRIREV